MKTNRIFKVVSRDSAGDLNSVLFLSRPITAVKYLPRQWTEPTVGGPLFAFSSVEGAINFAKEFGPRIRTEVWQGIGRNIRKKARFRMSGILGRVITLPKENTFVNKSALEYYTDTVFCDAIKLTKKIEY